MTVYVLRAEGSRLVKIGHTNSLERRLGDIRAMSAHPVEVLWQSGSTHGGESERKLHKVFKEFRAHGEWFDFGENDPIELIRTELSRAGGSVIKTDCRQARLASALRRLRVASGVSQGDVARRAGWVQPKVSRLETGVQTPTELDVRVWAAQTFATPLETEALLDMLSATNVEYVPTADLLRRGEWARQQAHMGAMEAAAIRNGEYQPAFLPSLLHSADYAHALLRLPGSARSKGASVTDLERIIAGCLKRQELVREPGRRWQFVIGEAALWSAPGGVDVQVDQLAHLEMVSTVLGVELGVMPLRAPMVVLPISGFRVFDDELVIVELLDGEKALRDDRATPMLRAFEALRAEALTGPDAVALIQRVATELRNGI